MGEPKSRASPARALAIAVGATVVALVATLAAGIAFLVPLFLLDIDVESLGAFVGLLVAGQVGFVAVGLAIARVRGMNVLFLVPTARDVSYALGGTVVALVVVTALSLVIELLGVVPGSVLGDVSVENPALLLWIGALSVVLVAPAEEFLFRGVVQGTLREAFGPVGAIAGASLLFGSLHLANYTGRPAAVVAGAVIIVAVGVVFGTLYELTDNIVVPVAAHGLYNLVLSLLAYVTI